MEISLFFQEQQKLLRHVSPRIKRSLFAHIDWSQRLIGIIGQRGVGKTTLMLQALKEQYGTSDHALYISVDNPFFKAISLYEFAIHFEQLGGKTLYIDEVHKYSDWSSHLKSIYDSTQLNIVFSGSSMLQIHAQEADLSRRAIIHRLANLSFREYLSLIGAGTFPAISLGELFAQHTSMAGEVAAHIKPLKHFNDYLAHGCYPFICEGPDTYQSKLVSIINQILESDLPYVTQIPVTQIDKLKKLLYLLAESAPFEPNISKLAAMTEISRATMGDYLRYLEQASLLQRVPSATKGTGRIRKPEKIYLYNTNLACAINKTPHIGTSRETFFVNQIKSSFYNTTSLLDTSIALSANGDFRIDNQFTIEVGGKNKGYGQIKDIADSYLAVDDMETGFKNTIPLWLFGFLY
ncbi:AAA ATPase [Desulfurispirillum indicum S5]|uniref:AAA ATPase n=1 Tax=Desulfurispirillum indicum (strain ATCC BAA-1389 / DSM 22839 / S5) TaxID=653733 RepID=E6W5Y5_DESIS|nr:AAA family ATPase [Desulfurispirillum indicum]ADU64924.1 AAA ATPase [Desulfurispirillum indicum S5]